MNLTSLKIFLCRNDVKIVIICTLTGGILQVLSKQYLKSNPEFLKDICVTKGKDRPLRFRFPRGGALIEISGVSVKIVVNAILNILAQRGLLLGVASSGLVVINKIPITAISTCLRDALPQNLTDLEKKKFILVSGKKICLDQCDQNLKYLFDILEDKTIPFEERKEIAYSVLTKYLNLKTPVGRRNLVLCLVFIIYVLYTNCHSSYYLMMKSLIKAIREGKITKAMARLIVRKLRKKGVNIDPELAEIVAS